MKRAFLASLLAIGFCCALAQERINLTASETKPANAQYTVERIVLQYDDAATAAVDEGSITIQLKGQNGEARSCVQLQRVDHAHRHVPAERAEQGGSLQRLRRQRHHRHAEAARLSPARGDG
jgi:hypothetical protein